MIDLNKEGAKMPKGSGQIKTLRIRNQAPDFSLDRTSIAYY